MTVPWFAAPPEASPRPWYYDGRDIFSTAVGSGIASGHRLVIPLPDTWSPSQRVSDADARLVVQAVNGYEDALRWLERAEASLWNPHDGEHIVGGNFHGSFKHAAAACRWCAFKASNSQPKGQA